MNLDPLDHERYVKLDINMEELLLLSDLLKIETIYQVRKHVEDPGEVDKRTQSIINTFGVFTDFDEEFKELLFLVTDYHKKYKKSKDTPISVTLSKNRVKVYSFLLTKTVELTLPEPIRKRFDNVGKILLQRITEALNSESIGLPKKEDSSDSISINMLGQKGIA